MGTLEELFRLVDDHLIGVWRFRQLGRKPLWCATYHYGGFYYDTHGTPTIQATLKAVQDDLVKLRGEPKSTGRIGRRV